MTDASEAPIDRTLDDLADRIALLFPGFDGDPEDLDDEDVRLELIREEHRTAHAPPPSEDGERMHHSLHLIVANQVLADNPPQAWAAIERVTRKGYTRHEALHMVAAGMSDVLYHAMQNRPQPPEVYLRYLDSLPRTAVRNRPAPTSRTGGATGKPGARGRRKRR